MLIMRKDTFSKFIGCLFISLVSTVSCTAETSEKNITNSGPSFNCNKAHTLVEKTICGTQRLSQLDLNLSTVYKKTVTDNKNIRTEQLAWIKQRNHCSTEEEIISCLENSYLLRIKQLKNQTENSTLAASSDWRNLTHAQWIDILKLSNRCSIKENSKHIRFLDITNINQQFSFLSITCETGAYQDKSINFLITEIEKSPNAKELKFNELIFDQGWKQQAADNVTGYININLDTKQITITRRYVGSWSCGYIAQYPLDDIFKSETLNVKSAKADNNCDNGVRRDEWPKVEITN